MVVVVAVFIGLGAFITFYVHAATPIISVEPEGGILSNGAITYTDSTASTGNSVKFAANTVNPLATSSNNCLQKPSSCGYPDATNTGVPSGTALLASTSLSITQDGTIIDSKDVTGSITINASNVIIKKSRITNVSNTLAAIVMRSGSNLLIEDSEIDGGAAGIAIGYGEYTIRRSNVHGGNDALRAGDNSYVYDSYIHDLYRAVGTHNDVVQDINGQNVLFQHNTLLAYNGVPGAGITAGDPMNSIFQIGNQTGNISNVVFDNNIVNGGNYSFNANWTNLDAGLYSASGIRIVNNRFGRDYRYGPKANMRTSLVVWANNIWDDTGAVLP